MKTRIVFLDFLRVIACLMVMVIHSSEPYYLGGGGVKIASGKDILWVTLFECLCRTCVPLFVMASAYLLFPLTRSTGEFFRRRFSRIVVPFVIWGAAYVWYYGDVWGKFAFNFPDAGGHLWFVPMLLGLYLVMPLLSPWAERVSERELKGWLYLWAVTLLFPFARRLWLHLWGAPSFGAVAYIWGECPWNEFGMFRYVSGFLGYMLLGFYFRKFARPWDWSRTLKVALPLWFVGAVIMATGFLMRLPGDTFPMVAPYADAVEMEMSIEYCGVGVAMTVLADFLIIRKFNFAFSPVYLRLIRPLAQASYGIYLIHLAILLTIMEYVKPLVPTPMGIVGVALATFTLASLVSILLGKIPKVGKWLVG